MQCVAMTNATLPIPSFFKSQAVDAVWRVPYQLRASEAVDWARRHRLPAADEDAFRVALLLIDVQNTFCIPDFELFVGGRSGTAAVDDNRRLCQFIYRNLHWLTEICPTMDTHQIYQIFHNMFLVDGEGRHPAPYTTISTGDLEQGVWRFNAALSPRLGMSADDGQGYLLHYARELQRRGKYELTIWPYHAMLGGIGHALVPAIEEAVFFHSISRLSPPDFHIKGNNPLTENYSVLHPEITTDAAGNPIDAKNRMLIDKLLKFDAVIIAGQAKSHCVAWTIDDLLTEIRVSDPSLAKKIYLLEDCTSPVVIPDVIDYTAPADRAFRKFADAGMHRVNTTLPLSEWPGFGQ
jgi:nicotinamidase-related amidase